MEKPHPTCTRQLGRPLWIHNFSKPVVPPKGSPSITLTAVSPVKEIVGSHQLRDQSWIADERMRLAECRGKEAKKTDVLSRNFLLSRQQQRMYAKNATSVAFFTRDDEPLLPPVASSAFNSLCKVLFTIRSLYLCAIGFAIVFCLGWDTPPEVLSCSTKKLYSLRPRAFSTLQSASLVSAGLSPWITGRFHATHFTSLPMGDW